ncbi:PAS domain-containing sensor histidine kinase [Sphingosinicella sp. YJ22]|uniref:hybrid sensor histidine kinase/response regulator n=1 Tax=Sphingosinicella sp. YJ22 TaxID=1104780 RepID=UPI001FAF5418|nr:PAS domain-containing sensor histidine kinase [Sphingosinicella sp. YJ22]
MARSSADLQEQRFQLLVNSVVDYAIYMIEADGTIATWNPGAKRFKGYEAEEIVGKPYATFFLPEDRDAGLPQRILATAASEGRFEGEGWRLRKDGTRFWAHVVVDAIYNADRDVVGFAKITRDLTERRSADQALRESEERFRILVQGVKDYAIYMLDADGRVTNWNAGAQLIKGYRAEEIVGEHFSRFYTDEDRAAGEPERALETARAKGKYEKEAWRVRKDGTRFWASVLLDPIYDEAGELSGYAKITRDITERKKAEEELEEARAALYQSQKLQALGELTGGIAHDFNNLLTVIRGSAELLLRPGLSIDKRERYLGSIIETADRATALTSHLLAFGRRQALKPEVLQLNVRLDAFAEMVQRTFGSKYEVSIDLDPELWLVEVDVTQLETALLNAAINGRDAMPDGGTLVLRTRNRPASNEVSVEVEDTGEGMPPEVVERVFEPFFTTKPVGKGTGLGLSQIHGFAAQTGGRAEISSRPGEGTRLCIVLPRSDKAAEEDDSTEAPSLPFAGLRVLLVEDNEQVRRFAEHLLEEMHCAVTSAESGEAALAVLDKESFDLLFTDVVMPGMSGVELANHVRKDFPDLPILLASGYSEEVVRGAANKFRMISKPYGFASVSQAFGEVTRSQAAA